MDTDAPRTRMARAAAERALVRVVHHYGGRPEFVLLGGLVPELLCARSDVRHAGTTDVDVQVDLEIAAGAVNTIRLEQAPRNAEFAPHKQTAWRWVDAGGPAGTPRMVVKFELLADLDDEPAESVVKFTDCEQLGAANLRGTGFTARDVLLAKTAAAHSRRKPKDWYDMAFVLIHNDDGGPEAAARAVKMKFHSDLVGFMRTALDDLRSNFADSTAQGPQAYVDQMLVDHPDLDAAMLAADAILAVDTFHRTLLYPPAEGGDDGARVASGTVRR